MPDDTPAHPLPATSDTALHERVRDFIAVARWFGGKGRGFRVAELTRLGAVGDDPVLDVLLATVAYDDGSTERYQIPVAWHLEPQERLTHALIAVHEGRFGYDAVHDRAAMHHLLQGFAAATPVDLEPVGVVTVGGLGFHRLPGHDLATDVHSTLFSGEQSNSSVMFGDDSLLKLFRKVTPGVNPDIAVHEVLTRAGSDHVAALYGWLERGDLQLGMLQQFLRTASDGWDLALASVRNLFAEADLHADEVGGDFAGEASRLGEALREVHHTLAEHFPTHRRNRSDLADLAAAMIARLRAAIDVEPLLGEHADKLHATYDALTRLDGDFAQQIHGDLHLGQTLRTVRGWKIVDFEGEPAKPLAERLHPDSPWRDAAGMLRSFSYAPRVSAQPLRSAEGADQREFRAHEWSARNREAFITAYAGGSLTDAEQTLLDAYIADKAVYEVVYEARNRPTWVTIPLEAIARIGADR